MASRVKEDEKNERTIRNLLKLPENRRCINCNSLGPQYVCTNFWTFVCTNCSGIHREFTHRVKSISMAKFTSQEVSALQGGGNASAKEIYLKEWDPQKQSLPDGSNVERLRNFIKHVYVDRRYTGERGSEKPPRGKTGETDDINENRRFESYLGGSRSPQYEDTYERRYSDRSSSGGRSPAYDQDNRQNSDNKKSPARTEIINDWRREDRFGNGRKSEDGRISDDGSKPEGRSPDRQMEPHMSSPPEVRPIREILGENATPLRIIEPPRNNSARSLDGSVRAQRTASSSSLASSNGNPAELKAETSLIDFDAAPEPTVAALAPQIQQPVAGVPVSHHTTPSVADNWANFDAVAEVKVSQAPSNVNPLESVLYELSAPASIPATGGISGSGGASAAAAVDVMSAFPSGNLSSTTMVSAFSSIPATPSVSHSMAMPPGGTPGAATPAPMQLLSVDGGNSFRNSVNGGQWTNMQPYQSSNFTGTGGLANPQPFTQTVGGPPSNQPLNILVAPNSQGPPHTSVATSSTQAAIPSTLETTSGTGGRKALPENLFTSTYPGWHTAPHHGVGFNMQYNMQYSMQMPMQTFPQPSKSTNPFDAGNEQPPVLAPTFPSMASLQGALPNMAVPTSLLHTSNLGTPSSTYIAPQPAHPLGVLAQPPSSSTVLPGSYLGQQAPNNMPFRPQGTTGFGIEGSAFGPVNPNQQLGELYSAPATQNTFSSIGGNPFG